MSDYQFRSLNEFFDFNCFSFPSSIDVAVDRVQLNSLYYAVNYSIVLLLFILILSIIHPSAFWPILIILLAATFLYGVKLKSPSPQNQIIINGRALQRHEIDIIFLSVSLFIFIIATGSRGMYTILWGLLLCVIHSAMRQRSTKAKGVNILKEVKDEIKGIFSLGKGSGNSPMGKEGVGSFKAAGSGSGSGGSLRKNAQPIVAN